VISQAERAEVLERVRRFLAGRPETAHGEFEVSLRTTVLRAAGASADVALEDQA